MTTTHLHESQPITQWHGFGIGKSASEHFYSQGMYGTPRGIVPGWNLSFGVSSATNNAVNRMNWYTQGQVGGTYVFGLDTANQIWKASNGVVPWSVVRTPASGSGNGLLVDQKNQLLYAGNQYLSTTSNLSDFTDS